jgi:hypothetical protein
VEKTQSTILGATITQHWVLKEGKGYQYLGLFVKSSTLMWTFTKLTKTASRLHMECSRKFRNIRLHHGIKVHKIKPNMGEDTQLG